MRKEKRLFKTNGDIVISSLPHNQKASDLYSAKILKDRDRLASLVEELLDKKTIALERNGFALEFEISGRNILTIYKFQNGGSAFDSYKFNSLFANNGPEDELLLSLVKAECNAELANNPDEIVLYNYPSIGFFVSENESKKIKYKLRKWAKNPYLMRFK